MKSEEFLAEWYNDSPYVNVQTSGSTGAPKQMKVEKQRMLNSARITCDFLGLQPGDTALLCMSLDYIAGKMMVVRALERGLRLITVNPSGHPLAAAQRGQSLMCPAGFAHEGQSPCVIDFAAMVPMQVYNSLQVPEERERLMQIRHLIIGGGAIDEAMAATLKDFPNAVWSTYGMTETLSHIALRRLSGPDASDWYTPFDSVRVSLNEDQCLVIDAPEVCPHPLVTNDIAELTQRGQSLMCSAGFAHEGQSPCVGFRILGRKDNVICSGGIKIQAEQVEQMLRPHMTAPFLITKRPDAKFGEVVVLLTEGDIEEARQVCQSVLPRYHQPRLYLSVGRIPMTETGKPSRHEAALLAMK